MSVIEKCSLIGEYGEVVQINPLTHTPMVEVRITLTPNGARKALNLSLYYDFITSPRSMNLEATAVDLFEDIRIHVTECLAAAGYKLPKPKDGKSALLIGFTKNFRDHHVNWPQGLRVLT